MTCLFPSSALLEKVLNWIGGWGGGDRKLEEKCSFWTKNQQIDTPAMGTRGRRIKKGKKERMAGWLRW